MVNKVEVRADDSNRIEAIFYTISTVVGKAIALHRFEWLFSGELGYSFVSINVGVLVWRGTTVERIRGKRWTGTEDRGPIDLLQRVIAAPHSPRWRNNKKLRFAN